MQRSAHNNTACNIFHIQTMYTTCTAHCTDIACSIYDFYVPVIRKPTLIAFHLTKIECLMQHQPYCLIAWRMMAIHFYIIEILVMVRLDSENKTQWSIMQCYHDYSKTAWLMSNTLYPDVYVFDI